MKTVIIINSELAPGLAANTAAVLGISLGHGTPDILGPDLEDGDGQKHPGITRLNIPVLSCGPEDLKTIYRRAMENAQISLTGFNTIAHRSRDYESYAKSLASTATSDLEFSGLSLKGPQKAVSSLTGHLKLYR